MLYKKWSIKLSGLLVLIALIINLNSYIYATGSVSITSITGGKDSTGVNTGTSITKNSSPSIVVSCTNGDKLTIIDNNGVAKSNEVICVNGTATLTSSSTLSDGTYKIKAHNINISSITNGTASSNTLATLANITIDSNTYNANSSGLTSITDTTLSSATSITSGKSCRTYVVSGSDVYVAVDGIWDPLLNESYATGTYSSSNWSDGTQFGAAYFGITASGTSKTFAYFGNSLSTALNGGTKVSGSGKASVSGDVTVLRDGSCSTATNASFALGGKTFTSANTGYLPINTTSAITVTNGVDAVNISATFATATVGGFSFQSDIAGLTNLNSSSSVVINNEGTASSKASITIGGIAFTAVNNGSIVNYSSTFNVDTNAPIVSFVIFSSNNSNPLFAKAGDIISVSIGYSESVLGNPTSTIMIGTSTRSLTFAAGQTGVTRVGTYTITGTDNGAITFPVSSVSTGTITDIAGNSVTTSNTLVGNTLSGTNSLTADNIAPTISSVSISSNNIKNNQYLKAGNTLTATITYSESVLNNPASTILIGTSTKSLTFASGQTGAVRTGTYTILSTDSGVVQLLNNNVATNTITDLAGNLNTISNSTSSNILTIDNISPIILSATASTTNNIYNNYAKVGDRVYVNYTLSEPVSGLATGKVKLNSTNKNLIITTATNTATTTISGYYEVLAGDDGEFFIPLSGITGVTDIADNSISSMVNNSSANVMITSLTNSVETIATATAKITVGGKTFTASTAGKLNSTSTLTSNFTNVLNGSDAVVNPPTNATLAIGNKIYTANNSGVLSGITSNSSTVSTSTNGVSCRRYVVISGDYYVLSSYSIDIYGGTHTSPITSSASIVYDPQYFINISPGSSNGPAHFNIARGNIQDYYFYYGSTLNDALTRSSSQVGNRGLSTTASTYSSNVYTVQNNGICDTPTAETITVGGQVFTNNFVGFSTTTANATIGTFTNGVSTTTTPATKAQFDFGGKTFISDDVAGELNLVNIKNSNSIFTLNVAGADYIPQIKAVGTVNNLSFTADNLATTSLTKSSPVVILDLGTASSKAKITIDNVSFTADNNGILDAYLPYAPSIRIDTVAPVLSTTTKVSANGSLSALFTFTYNNSFEGEKINLIFSTSSFATSSNNCLNIPTQSITSTGASGTISLSIPLSAGTYQNCVVSIKDLLDNQSVNQNITDAYNVETFTVYQYSNNSGGGIISLYLPLSTTTSNSKIKSVDIDGDKKINKNNTKNNPSNNVFVFKKEIKYKSNNKDVKELQKFLNKSGFIVANTGVGSIDKESTYFGKGTETALKRFQQANLKAIGIKKANGILDKKTLNYINNLIK